MYIPRMYVLMYVLRMSVCMYVSVRCIYVFNVCTYVNRSGVYVPFCLFPIYLLELLVSWCCFSGLDRTVSQSGHVPGTFSKQVLFSCHTHRNKCPGLAPS
jgi:hypothetical protein